MCAQFLGRYSEDFIPLAHCDEMTGALNGMPYRSWHSVGHRLVDGIRYESIVESLPHVDWPFDLRHVESPTPIEEFSITDEPVAAMGDAFGARVTEGSSDSGAQQNLSIVVVDSVPHLFDEGVAEVFGGDAKGRVHEAEAGFETQCEGSS